MILRNLKKEYTNNPFKGFTLMELLIGSLIASLSCLAIIYSAIYYQGRLYDVKLREKAHEELKGYTDFWKGKIASNDISSSGGPDTKQICLFEENNSCSHQATLKSTITPIDTGISHAERKGLTTSIEWYSRTSIKKEIEFYVEQLVLQK
tara:strand:- start:244 stop:693 length:450 start_codon:yes stop_codon:yes gene_type:complete